VGVVGIGTEATVPVHLVVAENPLPGDTVPLGEHEDPPGNVVEEIPIVCHRQHDAVIPPECSAPNSSHRLSAPCGEPWIRRSSCPAPRACSRALVIQFCHDTAVVRVWDIEMHRPGPASEPVNVLRLVL